MSLGPRWVNEIVYLAPVGPRRENATPISAIRTFKTVGHQAGIEDSVLDAICGHAPSTVGGAYGGVSIAAQRRPLSGSQGSRLARD